MSWPRELENSFPGPVSGSSAFGMVGRVYTSNTVSFQSERHRKIEIRFVNCPTDLTVKFHKLHSFQVLAGDHLHSVLATKVETRSLFGKSNHHNTKALGSETGLIFMY